MYTNQIVLSILSIPKKMDENPHISFNAHLNEIQNASIGVNVSFDDIWDALKLHPNFIQDWIVYSEDQRCSNAWYFRKSESMAYEVGLYVNKEGYKFVTMYEDAALACAIFIQKSLSSYIKIAVNGIDKQNIQ